MMVFAALMGLLELKGFPDFVRVVDSNFRTLELCKV